MFKNNIKAAIRSIRQHKAYSLVNILGLSAALASFIIILLYLNYELSYDNWNKSLKQTYKVSLRSEADYLEATPTPLASFLAQQYPNAEAATAIQASGDYDILLATGDKKMYQKGMVWVDSSFLKVFPFELLKGDRNTVLNQPNAIVLTEAVSELLFGKEDPIGKTVKVYNRYEGVVTGVMKNQDHPSHLNVKLLMRDPTAVTNMHWNNYSYLTYLRLRQPADQSKLDDDINRLYFESQLKEGSQTFEAYKNAGQKTALFTDQLTEIHNFPKHGSSNFTTVSVLLMLAALLLLAGAINFSNLAVAKSIARAKEVGIRKVLGSSRRQLVLQFILESGLQCAVSMTIAILVVGFAVPYFNNLFSIHIGFTQGGNTALIALQLLACLVLVSLISGIYPATFLSKFNASKVLKGNYSTGKKGVLFRNSLIVLQFVVAVFFITATFIINRQVNFMNGKDKGFSESQLLRIETIQKTRDKNFDDTRNRLMSVAGVNSVAKTTNVPGDKMSDTSTFAFKFDGKQFRMSSVKVSTDYFKTLDAKLIKGRLFNDETADQQTRTAIINETAAKELGDDVVGKTISFPDCDSLPQQIVGVVKDFNVQGFEAAVQPALYTIGNKSCMFQSGGGILVKLNSNQLRQSVAGIEQAWKTIEPDFPIRYSFVDDNFQQLFISYTRLQNIIGFFSIVAVVISVMGLFALAAFFINRRTKEIGIRKLLGANAGVLIRLLSKEFILLVLLAVIIAIPIVWWAMQYWLQTFAYRVNIGWEIFLLSGILIFIIALLTVSFQSIKAAVANPVKSLRSE